MFSKTITNSARFIKMPQEAQNLYFHLCMAADDDGVVEAFTIMQMLGSSEDVIRILSAKDLVRPLNEDMVAYIMDWNEHNLIRADRKIDSIYKDLLLQIVPEADIKQPKPRADTGVIPRQIYTGRPLDGIGKDRIGEDRTIAVASTAVAKPKKEPAPILKFTPEILDEKLGLMERNEGSYLDIIATYIREKPVNIENSKQLSLIISRFARIAKAAEGAYTNRQIFSAIQELKQDNESRRRKGEEGIDWTVETIIKKLVKK